MKIKSGWIRIGPDEYTLCGLCSPIHPDGHGIKWAIGKFKYRNLEMKDSYTVRVQVFNDPKNPGPFPFFDTVSKLHWNPVGGRDAITDAAWLQKERGPDAPPLVIMTSPWLGTGATGTSIDTSPLMADIPSPSQGIDPANSIKLKKKHIQQENDDLIGTWWHQPDKAQLIRVVGERSDSLGRVTARGTYRCTFLGPYDPVEVAVTVYKDSKDSVEDWRPEGGDAAIREAALQKLAMDRDKKKQKAEANLPLGREIAWKRTDAKAIEVQKCIDNWKDDRERIPYRRGTHIVFRKPSKRADMIRKIKSQCKVGRSRVFELEEDKKIAFPTDARKHKKAR